MAKPTFPLAFTWPEYSLEYFVAEQTVFTAGTSLKFVNAVSTTSPFAGSYIEIPGLGPTGMTTVFSPQVTQIAYMPMYNIRSLQITTSDALTGTLTINGLDINGLPLSEVVDVTGTNEYTSQNWYSALTSIIPNFSSSGGTQISVGTGFQGYLMWFIADVWSKNQGYTITYTDFSGSVNITPYYSISLFPDPDSRLFETTAMGRTGNVFAIPLGQPNVTASPSTTVFPIVTNTNTAISISIPLQGITTGVSTGGGFTQTIMQQGGKV
jgi:hypothetical protein